MACIPMKRRQGDGRLCELRIILHLRVTGAK